MEELYRLSKIRSAVSCVSSCLPWGGHPGDADVPKKCVSCRRDQRGDGWEPPAPPGSHVPVLSVSMLELVRDETPSTTPRSPEGRSTASMDLWEVGGGTVPPCGWRMKLNLQWDRAKSWTVLLKGKGRREKQSSNRNTQKREDNSN